MASIDREDGGAEHAQLTLTLAACGLFLTSLDVLIVNLSLPSIERALGGGPELIQWVASGYALPFAALLLAAGTLTDRIGASRAFAIGIAGFLATAILCAVAPTAELLVLARVLHGIAAAIILPSTLALVREAYPERAARARALGIWSVGGAIAGGVGPALGGALATIDWRLVFAINVPVSAAILVLIGRVSVSRTRPARFDWAGQGIATAGLTALVWGLIEGGSTGWTQPTVVAAIGVALISLPAFIAVERRVLAPMLPLGLFRPRSMQIALAIGFAFNFCWFGSVFVVSLHLQQQLGLSSLEAGLVFLPASMLSIAGNIASGYLANRFSSRVPMVAGMAMISIGLATMTATAALDSPWLFAVGLMFVGPGGSISVPSATGIVLDVAPDDSAGLAGGVSNAFRQLGSTLSIAVLGALMLATPADGLRLSLGLAALLGAVVAILATRLPRASG